MGKFVRNMNRCSQCQGCLNDYCRRCIFCLDMIRFGGRNIRRQACVQMRCHQILAKFLRSFPNKYRKSCGVCEHCTKKSEKDCGYCNICFDRMFFQSRFLGGALCNKRKCNNAEWCRKNPEEEDGALQIPPVVVVDNEKSMQNSIDFVVKQICEKGQEEKSIIVDDHIEKRERSVINHRNLLAIRKREKLKLYKSSRLKKLRKKIAKPVVVKPPIEEEKPNLHLKIKEKHCSVKSVLANFQKPRNPLEKAFVEILDDSKIENEKSPDTEQLMGELLDKIFALQKISPEQTLNLFATLPSAEFVHRLPNLEIFDDAISALSIDPVTVLMKNQQEEDHLSIDPILLGYIVSLDKDQLTSRLMSSNSFSAPSSCLQNPNSTLQHNNENAQLQMKLMQMHQEHHNYACLPK